MSSIRVAAIPAYGVAEVVDLLTSAFTGYEAMDYMLGDGWTDHRLRALVGYFVRSRSAVGSPILGVRHDDGRLVAAAVTDPPHPLVRSEPEDLRHGLGADVIERMERFGRAIAPLEPAQPHHYVGMIGVDAEHRRLGYATAILDHVQESARADHDSIGVVLTTERSSNVPIYASIGFEVIGEATTADGLLTSWTLLRSA